MQKVECIEIVPIGHISEYSYKRISSSFFL